MKIDIVTTKRVFHLRNLSEEEGLILRTLLNMSDDIIRIALQGDNLYWDSDMTLSEALVIACSLRDKVFAAVDSK